MGLDGQIIEEVEVTSEDEYEEELPLSPVGAFYGAKQAASDAPSRRRRRREETYHILQVQLQNIIRVNSFWRPVKVHLDR